VWDGFHLMDDMLRRVRVRGGDSGRTVARP